MKKLYLLFALSIILLTIGGQAFAQVGGINVQTNSATNIYNNSATLQGYFTIPYISNSNYVWFQWGTTTNYENATYQQTLNYTGVFSQNISNLSANTTYHYRAVAQNNNGLTYGQDMTFYTSNYGSYTAVLSVDQKVYNATLGSNIWLTTATAKSNDILVFAITLQPGSQNINNVFVRANLPAGLIYNGNLMVNAQSRSGDITSGLNIGTIYINQPVVVSYQAKVSPYYAFPYGLTTLTNNAVVTSTEAGTQTAVSSVFVLNSAVSGATTISTGFTNNFLFDSFFLPLALIMLMLWFYFSGKAFKLADWIKTKK